ncbi:ATP-binding protein [Paenibacillus sp. GCM10023252]|uniref:ATP-binding protein n=1 Tax=Paenibacillus sp. GCM10023252 TaxID=3252649 RepID=UPI00360DD90C
MIENIMVSEFKGLLYIMTACLVFLIVTPRITYAHRGRHILFLIILLILTYFYMSYEEIDPIIYAMHLTPVSLALASLFEGLIPGVATMGAFLVCGIMLVGNDWLPTTVGCVILTASGLALHYRKLSHPSIWQISGLSVLLVMLYLAGFLVTFLWTGGQLNPMRDIAIIMGSLLSSQLVGYTYYQVKNQEKLKEELFHSEKYQLIGQMAASISHEIRNPLTTTRGFLQIMEYDRLNKESFNRYRQYALEGIDGANAIITDYLNFSKPSVERVGTLDLKEEIRAAAACLEPLCMSASVELVVNHASPELLYVKGDAKKLQQCLLNVMKNAVESMEVGGVLTVSTRQENGKAIIFVRDTGVGMSAGQLRRIGMPFYTTKDKGTGLGLMVVLSLIRAMDGKTFFRSKTGQGTICEIHLPSVDAEGHDVITDLRE